MRSLCRGKLKMTKSDIRNIKCALVGNNVGKTCLLIRYIYNKYPDEYVPTVCDHETKTVEVDGQSYNLGLFDLGNGGEDYDRLRPLNYPGTDVFLVCFSTNLPDLFYKVKDYWVPEINHHCPDTPFLLVGTQIDLRDYAITKAADMAKNKQETISPEKGEKLALEVGAVQYLECSALTAVFSMRQSSLP